MVEQKTAEVVAEDHATAAPVYTPRADVIEFQDKLELSVSVPGVALDDVELQFEHDVLSVRGRRVVTEQSTLYSEFDSVLYQRTFAVPDGYDAGAIAAEMRNGVLYISVPRTPERQPRTIKVKA